MSSMSLAGCLVALPPCCDELPLLLLLLLLLLPLLPFCFLPAPPAPLAFCAPRPPPPPPPLLLLLLLLPPLVLPAVLFLPRPSMLLLLPASPVVFGTSCKITGLCSLLWPFDFAERGGYACGPLLP
jgi:hypothetical protein